MLDVKKLTELESYVHFEFYRVLKNYVMRLPNQDRQFMKKCVHEVEDVFPEVPVDGKSDLVVTIKGANPFLVIEAKQRRKGEANSCAWKMVKTKDYAERIKARFYAICNGWHFFLFERGFPYFLGAYGVERNEDRVEVTEDFARNLLMGLAEYCYRSKREKLDLLPTVPEAYNVEKQIVPAMARRFASEDKTKSPEEVEKEAEQLTKEWMNRIKK